ncbi:membrane protein insertion efficiency factor YidD [Rickettsiales endosymbiont of Stachyamoeba lipophora]|uniref:membrane protein insertion efficiency factor YidD n=1 Tax=Rickettsiales endosymbiont of Stachyamoeba lipophora TaxID=2486578 RepID=UPI000F649757|nr:membrane protein insertion efficiency factor YidD [Rickettsiales endosymbiont of Stachyamoeba lipophora]AZL15729.1 membrane protein insertion efficiency factor YidD [Rickettsiales endosymbiont of Stachyamoeba lipophora]
MTKILIIILKAYKLLVSPFLGEACRFRPTCSEYSIEALKAYGLLYGLILTVKRVIKCNPLGASGFDPVPPKK